MEGGGGWGFGSSPGEGSCWEGGDEDKVDRRSEWPDCCEGGSEPPDDGGGREGGSPEDDGGGGDELSDPPEPSDRGGKEEGGSGGDEGGWAEGDVKLLGGVESGDSAESDNVNHHHRRKSWYYA